MLLPLLLGQGTSAQTYTLSLSSSLTLGGTPRKRTVTSRKSGSITVSAVYVRRLVFKRAYVATITASGTIRRAMRRRLVATLTSAGVVRKKTRRILGSTLTISGTILKKIRKVFSGSTVMSSVVNFKVALSKAVFGAITSLGNTTNGPVTANVPDETAPVLLSFLRRFIGRR